ncbi:GSCFA domain-containing protein [Fibrobacter sp. UWB12]|uniref:GSCFA domain-containing protein n=1 Tax=Fibrobacter sp. UWB12 TaxID=1896203 RepID=UPI0009164D85|nr:GSCFA domain-containing protein [Fibrobacter sp. UWB12]SHK76967.1 GSCFA family protein [Fibrobacter sp. UWB12]
MNFFTKIDIPSSDLQIDYKSKIAFFGSCFANNISAQFASRKFKVLANPFGTVYNPLSIAKQIKAIADGKVFGEEDVFQDMRFGNSVCLGNRSSEEYGAAPWHCWDAHSSLSGKSREECIAKLNNAATQTRDFLRNADVVFITLGTSFVYFLKSQVVANCHRQDPRLFERRMISIEEAADALKEIVESLRKIKCDWIASPDVSAACNDERGENRKLHIVFTVSPLRHMSDGAHNNTLSKATLQLAINKVIQEIASPSARNDVGAETISYFPSYEIVMDELRDYRFYDDDMIHLSKTAEGYIFERMAETYCNEKTREDIRKVEKFMKMANHRIQDESSTATAEFLKKQHTEAEKLESQIAGLELNV